MAEGAAMADPEEHCGDGTGEGGSKTRSVRPLRTLMYVFWVCVRLR